MALRIGEYVLSGELRNTRRNSVFGWIEFAPDYGVRVELTGNFSGNLHGKHIKFQTASKLRGEVPSISSFPEFIDKLANRQIGVIGEIEVRRAKVPDLPMDDFLALNSRDQQRHLIEKDCLYLEWFSQDGPIVAEIIEPNIEYIEDAEANSANPDDFEPLEEGGYGLGFTEIHVGDDGVTHTEHFEMDTDDDEDDEDNDPYGLFGEDLEHRVAESLGEMPPVDLSDATSDELSTGSIEKRPWDEVIPDLDPETKAMYEQWDEIFEGKKDEPISYLFQTPLKLPTSENVISDEQAQPLVTAILAQLALLSVALDVCEHFTPLDTYRLLMKDILPTAKVHPNLAASEMVQHYSTSDYCQQCEAIFDAEYEATHEEEEDEDEEDLDA